MSNTADASTTKEKVAVNGVEGKKEVAGGATKGESDKVTIEAKEEKKETEITEKKGEETNDGTPHLFFPSLLTLFSSKDKDKDKHKEKDNKDEKDSKDDKVKGEKGKDDKGKGEKGRDDKGKDKKKDEDEKKIEVNKEFTDYHEYVTGLHKAFADGKVVLTFAYREDSYGNSYSPLPLSTSLHLSPPLSTSLHLSPPLHLSSSLSSLFHSSLFHSSLFHSSLFHSSLFHSSLFHSSLFHSSLFHSSLFISSLFISSLHLFSLHTLPCLFPPLSTISLSLPPHFLIIHALSLFPNKCVGLMDIT
jgi:hypothetical protein